MKKFFLTIFGLLILGLSSVKTFALSLNDLQDEVYRPENLPAGKLGQSSPEEKINDAIDFAIDLILYTAGGVAVLMLIFGGITAITSLGNQERKERSIKIVKYALLGLFTIILAYAVVINVIDIIFRATA